jgi:pimeloyl-ACP methyl ester carboxylesterase
MTYATSPQSPDAVIQPPSKALAALEPFRAIAELAGLWMTAPMLLAAPRGDGHCVLVLPGFGADDQSTYCLRRFLSCLGYCSSEWALGQNLGYRTLGESGERLRQRVETLAATSGRKISLVGWSLGGVMARHMGRDHPEWVRHVVTLGAPFTGDPTATSIRKIYEMISGEDLDAPRSRAAWQANRPPPSVPTTSIYSKSDGVTAWQNCLEIETATAENIEVVGSHLGLMHNAAALHVVADRLAQPENGWQPYAAERA